MKTRILALAGATALLATACGTTDPAADQKEPEKVASVDCAADTTATSTGPVTLTDSFGRTVKLDKPAERVAVLEWQQVEDALTLCVTPVAVSDPKGYSLWNAAEELPEGVADIGERGTPNIEALLGTNPDLIILEAYTADDEAIKQAEKLGVPVLATKGADAADPIQNMKDTFSLIAEATGREERAEVVLDEFDASLAEAKEEIADEELETTEFVYFDGWLQGGNVSLRPFGQGSLMGELGEAIGLTNAWKGEVDPAYGLGTTDIEGMSAVGDASFFYTGTVDPSGDVNAALAKNRIWKQIPAVEDGRAYAFPEHTWTFGGPRSSQAILDAYVALLTED